MKIAPITALRDALARFISCADCSSWLNTCISNRREELAEFDSSAVRTSFSSSAARSTTVTVASAQHSGPFNGGAPQRAHAGLGYGVERPGGRRQGPVQKPAEPGSCEAPETASLEASQRPEVRQRSFVRPSGTCGRAQTAAPLGF
eukprot:scaffold1959_cov243-Pinguiococcus_pyrenoidosus.AAC.1